MVLGCTIRVDVNLTLAMSSLRFSYIPEISIILPTYDRAQHLTDCVNSVIEQTFQDWELIIVDDGSKDHTFEVINPILEKYTNIRYIKHKNRRQGFSRNAGIQASFGSYITFIDSDDQYKPNHLQSRWEYMKAHPEVDLIQGGFETDGEVLVPDYFHPNQTIDIRECVICPTFFGKRHVFFELQGFKDMEAFEDTELWHEAEQRFKIKQIKEPLTYIYTRAQTSVTKEFLKNHLA